MLKKNFEKIRWAPGSPWGTLGGPRIFFRKYSKKYQYVFLVRKIRYTTATTTTTTPTTTTATTTTTTTTKIQEN